MTHEHSIFIFRRDLRLDDNTSLIQALKTSKTVTPIFIYDPRQTSARNKFKSAHALQYMGESLEALKIEIANHHGMLQFFSGTAETVIQDLIKKNKINAVFFNKDYTPFARSRDKKIERICINKSIACMSYDDALLHAPDSIKNKSGTFYKIFTPFFKHARIIAVKKAESLPPTHFTNTPLKSAYAIANLHFTRNPTLAVRGGPQHALTTLKNLAKFAHYARTRNIPSIPTTQLSASNKFGTVSIRRIYHALHAHNNAPLLTQLFWRDFFTHIAYHAPEIFKHAFRAQFRAIAWRTSANDFKRWCTGTTGVPLVDAGMRELNATGFMHNRVRMIAASFLVKNLRINWQWGERYFAQHLVDYDPAVNNGNWQWIASCGADAQPPFRIFNPWLQQKKFDPQAIYIKHWIPELRDVPARIIHRWATQPIAGSLYPRTMPSQKQAHLAKRVTGNKATPNSFIKPLKRN